MDYFKQSARIFLGLLSLSSFSANALELTPYESCLNKVLQQSADDMTVAEIKQACINRKMATLPLEKRRLKSN
jgi:hypothetical protein